MTGVMMRCRRLPTTEDDEWDPTGVTGAAGNEGGGGDRGGGSVRIGDRVQGWL